MGERPSIKTVAAAAGVSPSTVSNAYRRPEQMTPAVRERVLDAADRLGYPGPNPIASSLRSRRTGSVGVLFAQDLTYAFSDPYCLDLLTGIAQVASEQATNVLLMPVGPHVVSRTYSRDEELRLLQSVRQAALDGVIADGVDPTHPVLRVLAERGVPVVGTVDGDGPCVLVDDHDAAVVVGAHLRGLGHRRVVVVADSMDDDDVALADPDDPRIFPYARLRARGAEVGLGAGAQVATVSAGQNTPAAGRAAAALALGLPLAPTAIVATTDVLALGVLDELRERGLVAGQDVSVTGFDDVPRAAELGLTTVRQPVQDKGRLMARMLVDPLVEAARVTLPTDLVVRTSTGPAPQG